MPWTGVTYCRVAMYLSYLISGVMYTKLLVALGVVNKLRWDALVAESATVSWESPRESYLVQPF